MILRHLHNPSIRISLPLGGALQFENFICKVHPEVVTNNGEGFFNQLVLDGKVEIIDQAKKEDKVEDIIAPEVVAPKVEEPKYEVKVEAPVKSTPVKQAKDKK